MIRFRIGSRWKSDPRLVGALAEEIHDSVGIEVDGIDISRGLLEDRLFPTATALVEAVARLLEGTARTAAVPFDDGTVELILARHGDEVTLSLVSLLRPARVLVRDLEVELDSLAEGVGTCAAELLSAISELAPRAAAAAPVQRLASACRRLTRAATFPGESRPFPGRPLSLRSRPAGGTQAPALGFDLRDEDGRLGAWEPGGGLHALLAPGHLYLHGPDGEDLCSVAGPPFLLLRDLADVGLRLLEARRDGSESLFTFPLAHEAPEVEVDLRGAAVTVEGRTLRCPPEALARSLFAGALDFGGALLARHPALAGNPWLASLVDEARERMALADELSETALAEAPVVAEAHAPRAVRDGPPLAWGEIRRVTLRLSWRAETGPIRTLHRAGSRLWAAGAAGAVAVSLADGSAAGGIEGGPVAFAGPRDPLLSLDRAGHLCAHGTAGAVRWRTGAPVGTSLAPTWHPVAGERAAAVVDGTTLLLLDLAGGEVIFRLAPPAAAHLSLAAAGPLIAAAADNGLLYGIDGARGELAWRVPVGQPLTHLTAAGDRILGIAEGDRSLALVGVDAGSGAVLFRTDLPIHGVGELLPVPGGVVIAGSGNAGGEVLGADGVTGAIRSRVRPMLGARSPSLLRAGGALFARGDEGLCRIERGRVRWNVPCEPGGAPVLVRGLLVLPGEGGLELREASSGREPSVALPMAPLPMADHLLATREGAVVLADRDGGLAALRLAGALAVVPD